MEPAPKLFTTVVNRLNSRSFAMALAGLLFLAGLYLIHSGVTGGGVIDMQAAVIRGKLQSGSVGLFFVFGGLPTAGSCRSC